MEKTKDTKLKTTEARKNYQNKAIIQKKKKY